jgi:hypothetical protein
MTISSPPTATLAGVLVRHNASVEGRHRKNAPKGTQEAEERFTSTLIPSATGVTHKWEVKHHSTGAGVEHPRNGHTCRHMCLGPSFVILHFTNRECDVSPYTEVYESVKAVPIVSGATHGQRKEQC